MDINLKVDERHMQRLLKDIMNTHIDPDKLKTIGQERPRAMRLGLWYISLPSAREQGAKTRQAIHLIPSFKFCNFVSTCV